MNTFEELAVRPEILRALAEKNITQPTPVQREVIPVLLAGNDCIAQAPTGTGKTFAFGIPLLEQIDLEDKSIQAVIMCPTRELAVQTETELRALAKYCEGIKILAIYGGQSFDRQLGGLKKKPQIVVGTPGRILDHLERRSLRIKKAKVIVLDEADVMLDMGFRPDIDKILTEMPEERHTLLFSATISPEVLAISKSYQVNPVSVTTGCSAGEVPEIKQYVLRVKHTEKVKALDYVMKNEGLNYVLVFTNTIRMVDDLVKTLVKMGYTAEGLHGDLRQSQRDKVMRAFRTKSVQILVATDVAARGIDVSDIEAIFNYDVPMDNDFYVHRIGRTARAEKQGASYTFTTTRDNTRIKEIEKVTKIKMEEYYVEGISDDKLSGKAPDTKRIFVNLGDCDHITPEKMRDFICGSSSLKASDIKNVDVLELFSFVEVLADKAEQVVLLDNLKYMKRKVVFQFATERGERAAKHNSEKKVGEVGGKPYRDKAYSEKKGYGDKAEMKPYAKNSYGDKKALDEVQSKTEKKQYSKPYVKKQKDDRPADFADKKPYKKSYERTDKKPYSKSTDNADRKEYKRSEGDAPKKPYSKPVDRKNDDASKRYKTKEDRKTNIRRDDGNHPPRRNPDDKPQNKKRT